MRGGSPSARMARFDTGDPRISHAIQQLQRVIGKDIAVLISGEPGTGKSTLARAIHEASAWRNGPFVTVNCAASVEALSELDEFDAAGGTLFLDQIDDLPGQHQRRLLCWLEARQVGANGEGSGQPPDGELICSSRRDLRSLMEKNEFRADLYYRINGFAIRLPRLSERSDFAAVARQILVEEELPDRKIDPAAMLFLSRRAWPGNLRQLAVVLRIAGSMVGPDGTIGREHLPDDLRPVMRAPMEAWAIQEALAQSNHNICATARTLGISRSTVYRCLRRQRRWSTGIGTFVAAFSRAKEEAILANRSSKPVTVGIIANPVSARDIRRIVSNATNLQTAERVNIILRLLTSLAATGVERVIMMPDKAGLTALLLRAVKRERNVNYRIPELEFVDMPVTSTVEDTFLATRRMRELDVSAIVVLGGDGTHRAVVRELIGRPGMQAAPIPIAGMSTGTNNAFPQTREPTVVALAVGLYATGRLPADQALAQNKVLEVNVGGRVHDVAVVDAVISNERYVGARALWKVDGLDAVYLAFADPLAIGFSAIGGLLDPVARAEQGGLAVRLSEDAEQQRVRLLAPIAPGMVCEVGIANWERMSANEPLAVGLAAGVIALDGEREWTFDAGERVTVTLRENAFHTVDVERSMTIAATDGLFRRSSLDIR